MIVIAASTSDTTPEDNFKIRKIDVNTVQAGCYENFAVVTTGAGGPTDTDPSHYCNPTGTPDIDIEKLTNGEDADTEAEAVEIAPGQTVTWTYQVTNTGDIPFTLAQVSVIDDNGTPADTSDDFAPDFDATSDDGSDGILSPGEVWLYTASAVAQDLTTPGGDSVRFYFDGNTPLDGPDGNLRNFSAGGISVNASAFSRDDSGNWAAGYLGSYSGGLGVTDTGEGDGGNGRHRVDNVVRDNYVLFEFSQPVVIDQAFLDSVVNDSDITVWIGNVPNAYTSHITLSDSVLNGLGFTEDNDTTSTTSRWANLNSGEVSGNVIVIAASTSDSTPEDNFKIRKIDVSAVQAGCYENFAVVTTGAGGPTDQDPSHYCNPAGGHPAPSPTMVMFEAEDFTAKQSPWAVKTQTSASGGKYLTAPNGTGSYYDWAPTNKGVSYVFEVNAAGPYHVMAQVSAPNSSDNSFWVAMDGGEPIAWHLDITNTWSWQTVQEQSQKLVFDLEPGQHTLRFMVREDGTFLDKIKVNPVISKMIEAEDFSSMSGAWQAGVDHVMSAYGSGDYFNSPPTGNELTYDFSVGVDGQYKIHGLVNAPDSSTNSFWIKVDDGAWVQWHLTVTGNAWRWQQVTSGSTQSDLSFDLAEGNHTLRVKIREDGTRLDKILVTNG